MRRFVKIPVTQTIAPPQNAPQNVEICTPYEISLASQKVKPLMTTRKSPRVKMVIGSVKSVKTGLTLELIRPKIRPKKIASTVFFTSRPGRVWEMIRTTIVVIIRRAANSIILPSY